MKPSPDQTKSPSFFDLVYDAVCKIPKGKVATYGQIAFICGSPRAARVVGYALHHNPKPGVIPCHRVVNRTGRPAPEFAFGTEPAKIERLQGDGSWLPVKFEKTKQGSHVLDTEIRTHRPAIFRWTETP